MKSDLSCAVFIAVHDKGIGDSLSHLIAEIGSLYKP